MTWWIYTTMALLVLSAIGKLTFLAAQEYPRTVSAKADAFDIVAHVVVIAWGTALVWPH